MLFNHPKYKFPCDALSPWIIVQLKMRNSVSTCLSLNSRGNFLEPFSSGGRALSTPWHPPEADSALERKGLSSNKRFSEPLLTNIHWKGSYLVVVAPNLSPFWRDRPLVSSSYLNPINQPQHRCFELPGWQQSHPAFQLPVAVFVCKISVHPIVFFFFKVCVVCLRLCSEPWKNRRWKLFRNWMCVRIVWVLNSKLYIIVIGQI